MMRGKKLREVTWEKNNQLSGCIKYSTLSQSSIDCDDHGDVDDSKWLSIDN